MYTSSDILVDYSYLTPGGNIAGAVVLPVLCIAAVAARFWCRAKTSAGTGSDDWLILLSLIFYIGMAICIYIGVAAKALGYHTPKPPPGSPKDEFLFFSSPQQRIIGKLELSILWLQVFQLGFAKVSVVMFYRRIFLGGGSRNGKYRWFHYSTLALLALIIAWAVIFFFVLLFGCGTHFYGYWSNIVNLVKYCGTTPRSQMGYAICDFAIDIFIIIQPIPMVWSLQMERRRKAVVSGAFLLGALAVGASGLRMAMFIIVDVSFINPKQDGDLTVNLFLFWTVIESGLAVLAACLPSLLFLWQRLGTVANSAYNSLRSGFSMKSLVSHTSTQHTTREGSLRTSHSDRLELTRPDDGMVEAQISGSEKAEDELPPYGISVTRIVTQKR